MCYLKFCLFILITNATDKEIKGFLTVDDTVCITHYSFKTKCSRDKLLEIFYEFKHLKKFGGGGNTTIKKLAEGDDWYSVEYIYKYFIYRSRASYKREVDYENDRVLFKLIAFEHNIGIVPEVVSSSGYYKISKEEDCNEASYFQKDILDKALSGMHLNMVKKETKEFLYSLRDYVRKMEE